MIDALSTARSGLMAASSRLEAAAGRVASLGATHARPETEAGSGPVRVRYLPLPGGIPDGTEDLTTMLEAEASFKFNAVVLKTAADMMQALYDAID